MANARKQVALEHATYSKKTSFKFDDILLRIPVLSAAITGWRFAERALAGESKHYCRSQQWRVLRNALLYPYFASWWFEILKSPYFQYVLAYRKRIYFKPFQVYISINWTKKQKVKVIQDTYRFILSKGEAFRQVLPIGDGIEMARFKLSDMTDGLLCLGYSERHRKEGELVFSFICEQLGGMIATISFSFEEIKEGEWVCHIGCVQGNNRINDVNTSKAAQSLMHGLRPKSLIIFAVQELSRQLGLSAIYGTGDSIQAYRRKHIVHLPWCHSIGFNYNETFSECGGQSCDDGWYSLPLKPVRKDIQDVKSNKRAQYRRRYEMLDKALSFFPIIENFYPEFLLLRAINFFS